MTAGTKTRQLLDQAAAAGKPLKRVEYSSTGYGKKVRDSQRSRLYSAESVLRTYDRLLTEEQVYQLIAKVRSDAVIQRWYGDPGHIKVTISGRHKRTSWARYGARPEMVLAKGWGQQPAVVLHELAHFYASPAGDPGHDWLFCHIFLAFVKRFMGVEEANKLKASFKKNKIRFAPPRKRKAMSAAQKAAAGDRMAKARAARAANSIEPHVIAIKMNGRWGLLHGGQTLPSSGWLKVARRFENYHTGELHPQVFVRKTDAGIAKAVARIRTWPGEAKSAVAVPVSQLQADPNFRGVLPQDWEPILVPVA